MHSKNILFINFGGLGDEILFLPTILSVKQEFPNSHITLALEERSKGILALTDAIDDAIYVDIKSKNKYFELSKLLFKIYRKNFDIVISSGSNKFISLFLFMTFIKKRYGYNTGKLSRLLLTKSINLNKNQYAVNMYQDLVQDLTDYKTNLPIFNVVKKHVIPDSILIHPGVSRLSIEKNMIKTIPAEKWASVIEKLYAKRKKVFLIGGPDDKDCIETIVKKVAADKFENLYGTTKNVKDLAELISSAEKFVCSDSAPMHIAVGLGVKTYAVFGSTDYKKLIPQSENVIPITIESKCSLQPCLWEKRQTSCEKLECLDIPVEKIVDTILN